MLMPEMRSLGPGESDRSCIGDMSAALSAAAEDDDGEDKASIASAEAGTEIRAAAAMLAQLSGFVVAHPPGAAEQLGRLDESMQMLQEISASLAKIAGLRQPVAKALTQAKKKKWCRLAVDCLASAKRQKTFEAEEG